MVDVAVVSSTIVRCVRDGAHPSISLTFFLKARIMPLSKWPFSSIFLSDVDACAGTHLNVVNELDVDPHALP